MIAVAIIDDDERYVEIIEEYLTRYGAERGERFRVDAFADGEDIVEGYGSGYDIVFMDVEMHAMDGMTAARHIREMDDEAIIVFITNMAQYAIKGYEVDALDYVLKPISYFAFCRTLDKALGRLASKRTEGRSRSLVISSRGGVHRVPLSSLIWIESKGHRVTYHTENGLLESTTVSMKELEEQLRGDDFYRCSNGYLVNLAYVRGIQGSEVTVGWDRLEISRARRAGFVAALTDYAGRMV